MNIQQLFNTRLGVSLGLALGRALPPRFGYWLSGTFAKWLSHKQSSSIVKAVGKNQWIVRGANLNSASLTKAVEEVFSHQGRCFVDLYRNLKDPEGVKALVVDSPQEREFIQHSQNRTQGAFIVAPHISNFDICLLACAYRGLHGQVLTYGQPTGGYEIQNDIRRKTGLDITPVSPEIHQEAIQNLREGGYVITAVDRPIRRKAHYLNFFNHRSPMPVGHIRMALQANVPIIVASAFMDSLGRYHIIFSDPIPMQSYPDKDQEIKINGEKVLSIIEERIGDNPGQWLMYYPVWPDTKIPWD